MNEDRQLRAEMKSVHYYNQNLTESLSRVEPPGNCPLFILLQGVSKASCPVGSRV